jgi:tRNA (cmo5U34)-methyltransferase
MLDAARVNLAGGRVTFHTARLEQQQLPSGEFGLVTSALAIHHLTAAEKRDLYLRIAQALKPRGRFVLGDVVVPEDPADAVTPIDGAIDTPSRVDEQLAWLADAGLETRLAWRERDLAVLTADRPG